MSVPKRWGVAVGALAAVVVAVTLGVVARPMLFSTASSSVVGHSTSPSSGAAGGTASGHASAPGGVVALAALLASPDPRVQEQALPGDLRAHAGQKPGVLPVGSTVKVDSRTWVVTGVDATGTPSLGTVQATVTSPGKAPAQWRLHVLRRRQQWFLYGTEAS